MKQLAKTLERRGQPRIEWHLPCKLLVDGRVHRGDLWDVSVCGFFVATRADLRNYFEVDARFITLAALSELARDGKIDPSVVTDAIKKMDINPEKVNPFSV